MRYFTVLDLSLFKVCLIAMGILLGYYYGKYIGGYVWIVWVVAIISYIALMVQLIRYYSKK